MKEEPKKHHNAIKWTGETPAAITLQDLKKYVNSLKVFLSYEETKGKLTVSESAAISAEIAAWSNYFGILNRIKYEKVGMEQLFGESHD